jgi:hypothetical protein
VYGSQAVAAVDAPAVGDGNDVLLGLGWPLHTCVAAFAAAVGGLFRSVDASFPDEARSLGFDLNVFNMPPDFFSGLGVLARGCEVGGGVRLAEALDCRLMVRGVS